MISAATRWKAAEEGSPGTLIAGSEMRSAGSIVIAAGAAAVGRAGWRSTRNGTPQARSIRSV